MQTTRANAKQLGEKHYFTGKPCKYNHVFKRLVTDGSCCECNRLRNHNQDKKEYLADWIANNKDKVKSIKQKWQSNNKAFRTKGKHKRKEAVKLRTPVWLNPKQKKEMNGFYNMAAELETVFPWIIAASIWRASGSMKRLTRILASLSRVTMGAR